MAEGYKQVLANLVQVYRYDLSAIRGYELTPHGTFVYRFLDHCFTESGREVCFITAGGQLAGFTMTRELGDGPGQWPSSSPSAGTAPAGRRPACCCAGIPVNGRCSPARCHRSCWPADMGEWVAAVGHLGLADHVPQ